MTGEQKPGGLEVVARRYRWTDTDNEWSLTPSKIAVENSKRIDPGFFLFEALTPAEPAEARIRELTLERDSYRTSEGRYAGMLKLADARATAAEAKLARAVEGLERIVHWRVEMTGTPVDTEAANAWAITFDAAATEASQTLAALQQEGE